MAYSVTLTDASVKRKSTEMGTRLRAVRVYFQYYNFKKRKKERMNQKNGWKWIKQNGSRELTVSAEEKCV